MAGDADVVAEVEEFVEGEGGFADVVLADVELEALAALLELREAGFALDADGHDAAGDGGLGGDSFKIFGGAGLVCGAEIRDGVGEGETVGEAGFGLEQRGVRGAGQRGDLRELVAAELVEVFFEG